MLPFCELMVAAGATMSKNTVAWAMVSLRYVTKEKILFLDMDLDLGDILVIILSDSHAIQRDKRCLANKDNLNNNYSIEKLYHTPFEMYRTHLPLYL